MIIYYLYHEYELYENCMERKDIGLFVSEAEAEELICKYQKLPGFEDYPQNFYIQEIALDNSTEVYSDITKDINNKDVYAVHKIIYYKEHDQEAGDLLGCFTTLSKAESFVETIKSKPMCKDIDITLKYLNKKLA